MWNIQPIILGQYVATIIGYIDNGVLSFCSIPYKVNYTIAPLYQSFFIGKALATACTWKKLAPAKSETNMTA